MVRTYGAGIPFCNERVCDLQSGRPENKAGNLQCYWFELCSKEHGIDPLEQKEWIVPISNELESIKIDIERLELLKNASIDEKTPAFAEVYSRWGG